MGQIVHFGLGNFARAHLLDYTADAGGRWQVIGVNLRSSATRDGLAAQGYAYALNVQGTGIKQITGLKTILLPSEGQQPIFEAMGNADIISATVTEKGYHLDQNGQLDFQDPVIAAELSGPPLRSLIGFIAHDLARRHRPVTILSCDNRVGNGDALRQAVQQFAQAAQLNIDWRLVRFPNAMVDRITPATTDRIRQECKDPMAVPTEAFREWVIEDNFAGPRPDWPDVQFVQDVQPHELRKLRMLNGAHSFLAYAGLAQGYQYVHEAISDPDLRGQALSLMMEAGATLPQDIQDQVPAYAQALLRRFDNTELAHRLNQIAVDGSQKLPYRILETLRARAAPVLIAAVRAWMSYCITRTAEGEPLDDPLATDIAKAANSAQPERMLLKLIGAEDLTQLILE